MKLYLHRLMTFFKTFHLGSLRFLLNPSRFIRYLRRVNTVHFSYSRSPIRTLPLSEILGVDFRAQVDLPFGHIKSGSSPLEDLACLAALAKKKSPKKVFEIGTFEGLTSVVFAKNSDPGVQILSLDLPSEKDVPRTRRSFKAQSIKGSYQSGYLIDVFGSSHQVERLYGDSALFDFKEYENSIDFFFVDGSHTEEYVARDSLSAFKSITSDGWILWHDCFIPDVFKVLKRIAKHHPLFHVGGTNLALSLQKPDSSFPLEILEFKIR